MSHRPIVVAGPSGAGKSTLLKRLFAEFPNAFGFSVSHTTRAPRSGEIDGREYNFVTHDAFQRMIHSNAFIEWARVSGNFYGTSVQAVKQVRDAGRTCVLDIDVQGVCAVKKTDLQARFVFVAPPSMEVLEKRLVERGTESAEAVGVRLKTAAAEMRFVAEQPNAFDFVVVNDDLEKAYEAFKHFVLAAA